jgi:hypothetical protein
VRVTPLSFNSSAAGDGFALELSYLISKKCGFHGADEIAETIVWQARNESRSHDGTADAGAARGLNPILSGDGLVKAAARAQQDGSPNRRVNASAGESGSRFAPHVRRARNRSVSGGR